MFAMVMGEEDPFDLLYADFRQVVEDRAVAESINRAESPSRRTQVLQVSVQTKRFGAEAASGCWNLAAAWLDWMKGREQRKEIRTAVVFI